MLIDILIGLFAANAIPHFLIGKFDARILGLFGYGAKANLAYSYFCMAIALGLFHYQYGITQLAEHGMLIGVLLVVFGFYLGWPIVNNYLTDKTGKKELPN